MSNLKRKGAPGDRQSEKPAKNIKEGRPSKSHLPDASAQPTKRPRKTSETERPSATVVSLLRNEEPAFIRGGGSVLTPLEHKQIQLKANADARREEEFETGTSRPHKKQKKTKAPTRGDGKGSKKVEEDDSVKVESLSFKNLVKGSLVLAQIYRINKFSIEVALPNNLTGHVSIVAVSEQLSKRLHQSAARQDEEDDSSEEVDVDLKSIFTIGQYLRVYVISTMDESVIGKHRKKIELSLKPAETNSGLGKDDVVTHSTVMASVVSVEERGCIMDVGIPDLRAFLPNSEVDPSVGEERLQEGAVFLCQVTGTGSNGNVAQLSIQEKRLGNPKSTPVDATTINTFLPGTAVSAIVTNVEGRGLTGKVLGHLDVTADLIHSGAGPELAELASNYTVGTKVKARLICNFPNANEPKLGISMLPHVTSLTQKRSASRADDHPTTLLPISSLVEHCTVRRVEPDIGLFVDIGVSGFTGFVHISRVKDGKVDALYVSSGPYKVDSVHKGRVVGYSEMDGLFHLSFEQSILEQQFIRVEDVPIGAVLTCEIEKIVVKEEGVHGMKLRIAPGISGFVTERHLSDIKLQHPERKFREGMKVKARVLSTNPSRRQIRLTLKKTLVNSEAPVVASYEDLAVGTQVPGTILRIQANGAQVQFYGSLRGFLPISEMSEAYIGDPTEHFRLGQVVSVHVLEVDLERRRLIVSCKDPEAFGLEKQTALKNLNVGDIVAGKVSQKTEDVVFLELADSQLKAILPVGHLTDKSTSKNQFAWKRINAGQTLTSLMLLEKDERRRTLILTQKPSLVNASREGKLLTRFADAIVGQVVPGFVRNITPTAVFVEFASRLHALLPRSRLPIDAQSKPDFGLHKFESIEVRVISVIEDMRRIMVAAASEVNEINEVKKPKEKSLAPSDGLAFGAVATARITSIKETQLNVQLLDGQVQGRVDVSQTFDKWEDIQNPKAPLTKYHKKQEIEVRVLGIHNSKDHMFLPFSHRSTHSVLELTAKPSDLEASTPSLLTMESLNVGDSHIAYVNNVTAQYLWVNLSPSVRGRVSAMEASDDLSLLNDLEANFPIGSALKVRVTSVDKQNNHLDLSARSPADVRGVDWSSLKQNMILPGKITKVNERQIMIKLSEIVSGPVHLPDMADDYDEINTLNYKKNQIVRVAIVELDATNKRVRLSMRPSRIMSSALLVADKEVASLQDIAAGDIVRGFVKNVSDKGLFVLLGGRIVAMVKISNLSDSFIKEWKDQFQVDQIVKGRVLSVDTALGHVELSLKSSAVNENYVPPLTYKDISKGQVVTGKVRKVEVFGAFILIDKSTNVSGLCHRSQMADEPVSDATKLYKEGDAVKAVVLDVNAQDRKISFGLKPSLFDENGDTSDDDSDAGVSLNGDGSDVEMDDGQKALLDKLLGDSSSEDETQEGQEDDDDEEEDEEGAAGADLMEEDDMPTTTSAKPKGLGIGKKATWSADPFDDSASDSQDDAEDDGEADKKKKKKRRAQAQVDRTAELDANGPQTSSDYERLLLGQPDASELWIAYMAFQMQVSDLSKAREVAERAIKSINIREETEKLNVWVAYLNLEVAYGTTQTVEEVFKRACQYNDEQEIHERLASIYIQSEKLKLADELFEAMLKKFGAKDPSVWTNYAHFLFATLHKPSRARALLPRAVQQLEKQHHQSIIGRFAALEFRCADGEPERGRTMFEGLLAAYPKKGDLWSQLLDLEMGVAGADETAVRDVFERRTRVKGLKPQQAKKWFQRWDAWEKKLGAKGKDTTMMKAQEWVAQYKARKAAEAAQDEMEE